MPVPIGALLWRGMKVLLQNSLHYLDVIATRLMSSFVVLSRRHLHGVDCVIVPTPYCGQIRGRVWLWRPRGSLIIVVETVGN